MAPGVPKQKFWDHSGPILLRPILAKKNTKCSNKNTKVLSSIMCDRGVCLTPTSINVFTPADVLFILVSVVIFLRCVDDDGDDYDDDDVW